MKVEQLAKYYLTATLVVVFASIGALGALSIKDQDGLVKKVSNKFATCTPQALSTDAVGGLSVAIPKLPDALRLNYGDNNTAQYTTKSKPEQIFTYYLSELPNNCWKLVALQNQEAVWKRNGESVRIATTSRSIGGKTIVSYEAAQGQVLGVMVRAAQTTTCSDGQIYCPGSSGAAGWCQGAGTTCPTPTTYVAPTCPTPPSACSAGFIYDTQGCATGCQTATTTIPATGASSCTANQVWCSSSTGGNGWCQMPPCPSPTNTNTNYNSWPNDRAGCTAQNQLWCESTSGGSGWCQMSGTACPSATNYNNWPTDQASCTARGQLWCNGTNGGSGACQMAGTTCPSANNTNTNYTNWPNDRASCTAQGKLWCDSTSGSSGWCIAAGGSCPSTTNTNPACGSGQMWCPGLYGGAGSCVNGSTCPTVSNVPVNTGPTACSSDRYWCVSANTCIPTSSSCAPINTNTYAGDTNSCPGFSYSKWDKQGKRYCQLNNERRCDYNYPSYLTNGGNYTATNCPIDDTSGTPQPVPPTNQREQIWSSKGLRSWVRIDADQSRIEQLKTTCANVSNMANVWLPEAGNSTSRDFGFPSADKCAKAAACTATQYFDGTSCSNSGTTANPTPATCGAGQMWCAGSNSSSGWCQMAGTTCPTYTTPSCRSNEYTCNNVCIPSGTSCNNYPYYENNNQPSCGSGSRYCSTQARCVQNNQPCETPAVNTCPTSMYWCPNQNRCVGNNDTCGAPARPEPLVNLPINQPNVNQPVPLVYTPVEINDEQFQMMKRNLIQFSNQIKQMSKQVEKIAKQLKGEVGIPAELKAALTQSTEIITKIKNAKTANELEGLADDVYDVVQTMQEWGPRLGDLMRLKEMLTQSGRETRSLQIAMKRADILAKRNVALTDIVQELRNIFTTMNQALDSAKELAKTDPEGALDKLEIDFYGGMEEFWNQNDLIEMLSNIQKGSSNASQQIRKAETEIRNAEKAKKIGVDVIADFKTMIVSLKEKLTEVKKVASQKPINQDDLFMAAEDLWESFTDFKNKAADYGINFYTPNFKRGAGINFRAPQGFATPPPTAVSPEPITP